MTSGFPVLVGTDLSDASFSAIRQASAWAERHQLPLVVAHVNSGQALSEATEPAVREAIEEQLRKLIDVPAEIRIAQGAAHAGLIQLALEQEASLLVVGASGAGTLSQ